MKRRSARVTSWLLAGAVLAVALGRSGIAIADEPGGAASAKNVRENASIFAVIATADDRFGQRVIAELESLGFEARRMDPPDQGASRGSLEVAARSAGALAAIRAVPSAGGVEIWIADRVTGKTVLREIAVNAAAADPESELAIRTVELLRASLLEVSLPAPPRGEVAAPPDVRDKLLPKPLVASPPSPPTLRLALSAGVLVSPGGFGPAGALDVGLAWMPTEHLGAAAFASLPLSRPRVSGAAGSADLATLLTGVGMRFLFTGRESTFAPSLDLGLSALSLHLTASANQGFSAAASGTWTAAPFARAGLAFAPHPMLRLRADLLLSAIVGGVTVKLAGEQVATFGLPIVAPSAGVDFGWF